MKSHQETGQQGEDGRPIYVSERLGGGLDMFEIWSTLWSGKWLIVVATTVFAVIGIVYSLAMTPVYRSEVVLASASRGETASGLSGLGGLADLAGVRLNSRGDRQEALAIFRSKEFLKEFIESRDLLPVLFAEEWDSTNDRWKVADPDLQKDIRDGVRVFANNIRFIDEDSRSGLITLSIEWTDPKSAAEWAMALVERINERIRNRDIKEFRRKLDYLNEQLGEANLVELRQAIARVIEDQISAMTLAQAQTEYAFAVIDPAVEPKHRIRPKRTLIVIVAALLGALIGSLFALARASVGMMAKSNSRI